MGGSAITVRYADVVENMCLPKRASGIGLRMNDTLVIKKKSSERIMIRSISVCVVYNLYLKRRNKNTKEQPFFLSFRYCRFYTIFVFYCMLVSVLCSFYLLFT